MSEENTMSAQEYFERIVKSYTTDGEITSISKTFAIELMQGYHQHVQEPKGLSDGELKDLFYQHSDAFDTNSGESVSALDLHGLRMFLKQYQHAQETKPINPVYTKGVYSAHDIGTILKDGKKSDIDELITTLNAQEAKPANTDNLRESYGNPVHFNCKDGNEAFTDGYVMWLESKHVQEAKPNELLNDINVVNTPTG